MPTVRDVSSLDDVIDKDAYRDGDADQEDIKPWAVKEYERGARRVL